MRITIESAVLNDKGEFAGWLVEKSLILVDPRPGTTPENVTRCLKDHFPSLKESIILGDPVRLAAVEKLVMDMGDKLDRMLEILGPDDA